MEEMYVETQNLDFFKNKMVFFRFFFLFVFFFFSYPKCFIVLEGYIAGIIIFA